MDIEALRFWSKFLLWTSVILPVLAAIAVGARYYVELRIGRLVSEQAKTEISALQSELRERKTEISELQSRTSARRLTDAQREVMGAILSKAAGAKALVACKLLDGESCDYAEQLAQVLRAAKWIVDPINKTSLTDLPGVVAVYRPFQSSPPGLAVLVEALRACGVRQEIGMLDEESSKGFGADRVYVVVGRKGS